MLIRNLAVLICLVLAVDCQAGVETKLFQQLMGKCQIEIFHDATPTSKNGAIVIKSYVVKNGINEACSPDKEHIAEGLQKAFVVYLNNTALKPVTSIFIRRLVRYEWIKQYLVTQSKNKTIEKVNAKNIGNVLMVQKVIEPFSIALINTKYKISGIDCEKIIRFPNGALEDALCWLELSPVRP